MNPRKYLTVLTGAVTHKRPKPLGKNTLKNSYVPLIGGFIGSLRNPLYDFGVNRELFRS